MALGTSGRSLKALEEDWGLGLPPERVRGSVRGRVGKGVRIGWVDMRVSKRKGGREGG